MAPSLALLGTRRWTTAIIICSLLMFFIVFRDSIANSSTFTYYTTPRDDQQIKQIEFWQHFQQDLESARPGVDPVRDPQKSHDTNGWDPKIDRIRPDYLTVSSVQQEGLARAHATFTNKIQRSEYHLPYTAGTRGIVTTADGPYLPVALVSIRMIREAGSNLPVEVFLANWKAWDAVFCNGILPALNAKCVILQDIFDHEEATRKTSLEKYQFKIMSILLSSFEEVLFLDSDCFPVRNPDAIFDSEPFRSTGLVVWPDFWAPSESHVYFEIAGIQAPNISDRASRESGEMLYSKSKHEKSLLLAAYYNFYGPDFYYPLLSQGAMGEGDKETFLWSAIALHAPYYAVKAPVRAIGYKTKDGDWRGSAMAQFDPIEDYHSTVEYQSENATAMIKPLPLFTHVNFPKIDPGQIFETKSFGTWGPTKDSDGKMRRIWHDNVDQAVAFFGFDVEKRLWTVVKELACEYEHTLAQWYDKSHVCQKANDYWNTVFGG